MVVELNREDLELAIKMYVEDKILSYGNKENYTMKITQGKVATAKVVLTEVVPDITE